MPLFLMMYHPRSGGYKGLNEEENDVIFYSDPTQVWMETPFEFQSSGSDPPQDFYPRGT